MKGGTLTRAKRLLPSAGRISTAPTLSERSETYGNGCEVSTASGTSTGCSSASKRAASCDPLLGLEVLPGDELDAGGRQCRQELAAEEVLRRGGQLEHPLADLAQLPLRRAAVRHDRADARLDLVLEARHAHLEELVQVAREDRDELQALEQRAGGVLRLREHAPRELQPGELAVQEAVRPVSHGAGA